MNAVYNLLVANSGANYTDLCASFPNLRALQRLDATKWDELEVPKLPPKSHHGHLDNGIAYYVLPNREPQKRVQLQLVVGFGSLVEEDDQCGIAHIIEHLGFSATKNFENHQLVKFLESIGAQFGACQNAYTSFDETVYFLEVPTDEWDVVKQSLTVLREMAFWTRIAPEDLAKERGVVLDEWRKSKNASGRLAESYTKAVTCGCKYEHRLPIGTEDVIRNVSANRLREFYHKFYHPKRMAVIAVGDIESEDKMIQEIRALFDIPVAEINRTDDAPERPKIEVPRNDRPRFVIDTDPELSLSICILESKQPKKDLITVADFRRDATHRLFFHILNNRLYKVTMQPENREFYQALLQHSSPVPPLEGMQLAIMPADGKVLDAIKVVLREVERAKAHGFYEAEVIRARKSLLSEFEEALIEKNQTNSAELASEFVALYLRDSPMPGIEWECRMIRDVLEVEGDLRITAEEISQVAKAFIVDSNSVIKICEPKKFLSSLRQRLPTEQDIFAVLEEVRKESLEPWVMDEDDPGTRIERLFQEALEEQQQRQQDKNKANAEAVEGSDTGAKPRPQWRQIVVDGFDTTDDMDRVLGHEVTLRNGMKILMKPTDFFDDVIMLRGTSWGGLSEYMDKDHVLTEAMYCSHIITELGMYGMRPDALNESLEGLRLTPPIMGMDTYQSFISGDCSPANFKELLMMLHLLFVKKVDPKPEHLQNVMQMLREARLAEDRDPQHIFQKRCDAIISCDHAFYRQPPLKKIMSLNFEKACHIFNSRFDHPESWTFVIVGKLPHVDEMLDLLMQYVEPIPPGPLSLSSSSPATQPFTALPSLTAETVTPLRIKFPARDVREAVQVQMVDPVCQILLCFPLQLELPTQESPFTEQIEICKLAFLWRLLEKKLQERLRFEMGKTYTVAVGDSFARTPPSRTEARQGVASISFSCNPAEIGSMIDAVLQQLRHFRLNGFAQEDVESIKEQEKRNFEKLLRDNAFWQTTLTNLYFSRSFQAAPINGDIGKAAKHWKENYESSMSNISDEQAKMVLNKYLPEGGVNVEVSMVPKRSLRSILSAPWTCVCSDRRE